MAMTHAGAPIDWQALVALSLVALAAAYLARRWWPGLRGLFGAAATNTATSKACGDTSMKTSFASCNNPDGDNGCGNCGQHTTPAKDHRIHIMRRPSHTGHSPRQG